MSQNNAQHDPGENYGRELKLVTIRTEITDRETGEIVDKRDLIKGYHLGNSEGERSRVRPPFM